MPTIWRENPTAVLCRAVGLDPSKVIGFELKVVDSAVAPQLIVHHIVPYHGEDAEELETRLAAAVKSYDLVERNHLETVEELSPGDVQRFPGGFRVMGYDGMWCEHYESEPARVDRHQLTRHTSVTVPPDGTEAVIEGDGIGEALPPIDELEHG